MLNDMLILFDKPFAYAIYGFIVGYFACLKFQGKITEKTTLCKVYDKHIFTTYKNGKPCFINCDKRKKKICILTNEKCCFYQ